MKTWHWVWAGTFAAVVSLSGSSAHAQSAQPAQPSERCRSVVAHRLEEYGLSIDRMKDLQWFASPAASGESTPVSTWVYGTPDRCVAGRLVVMLTEDCYILNIYTRPPCQIEGIPDHWW